MPFRDTPLIWRSLSHHLSFGTLSLAVTRCIWTKEILTRDIPHEFFHLNHSASHPLDRPSSAFSRLMWYFLTESRVTQHPPTMAETLCDAILQQAVAQISHDSAAIVIPCCRTQQWRKEQDYFLDHLRLNRFLSFIFTFVFLYCPVINWNWWFSVKILSATNFEIANQL
jgi:hypothetical protein